MMRVEKMSFSLALIFSICVKFLDEFITVLLILLLLTLTTLLLLALNIFKIKSNNLVVFNIEISSIAILLRL